MSSSNPYRSPKSDSSSRSRYRRTAVGPILTLGTVCISMAIVIQVVDAIHLHNNAVSMIGLPLVGVIAIGIAFSIYRIAKRS